MILTGDTAALVAAALTQAQFAREGSPRHGENFADKFSRHFAGDPEDRVREAYEAHLAYLTDARIEDDAGDIGG